MAKYTVRIEKETDGYVAWIDQDGLICIRQENIPGVTGKFETEKDAKAWADSHANDLETAHLNAIAEVARKKEMEDAAHAANLASIETSKALQALVAHLANPSA